MTSQQHPAFAFATLLRDAEFRRYLIHSGYYSGMPVVALNPEQTWEEGEAMVGEHTGPVLLARQDDHAVHGWDLCLHE